MIIKRRAQNYPREKKPPIPLQGENWQANKKMGTGLERPPA